MILDSLLSEIIKKLKFNPLVDLLTEFAKVNFNAELYH